MKGPVQQERFAAPPDVEAPRNVDASLPQYIEETGIDLFATPIGIFRQGVGGAGELMSYCGGPNRWPSVVLWHKLIDLLKV